MITHPTFKPRRTAGELWTSIVFAAFIIAIPLGAKLVRAHGGLDAGDMPQRAAMVLTGGYLMLTGNALPKRLAPLAGLRDDPAAAQMFSRFAGWTWTLTGLVLIAAWLLLSPPVAGDATLFVVPTGMLLIAVRRLTLPRSRRPLA